MFDFLTKHFLILSSLVVGVASAISLFFLASYLTVFNWSLIWLIEYGDLAKLFLIGTALMSSVATLALSQLYDLLMWLKHQVKAFKWVIIFSLVITILGFSYSIFNDVKTNNDHVFYHVFRFFSGLIVLFLIYRALKGFENWKERKWVAVVNDLSLLVLSIAAFGTTFGLYVKDVSKDSNEITTKNESFKDAKIIMMLSHHIAFYSDQRVIVVPTADLVKIVSRVQE